MQMNYPLNITLPMPNNRFDGGTVIASVWGNDDPTFGPYSATLLILMDATPYYRIDYIEFKPVNEAQTFWEWKVETRHGRENIVEAVECYQDNGGDF